MTNRNKQIDFIGIGFPKCATTWIYKCLEEHPEICTSKQKELTYFINLESSNIPYFKKLMRKKRVFYKNSIESYLNNFNHCHPSSIKGEWSTNYIFDENAARNIYNNFPNVKIIACLRNPVDRALSHYKFAKNVLLWEKSTEFKQALNINNEVYIEGGMYYKRLLPFFKIFPRKNIKIVFFEDMVQSPLLFMQDIYSFLGVNKNFSPTNLNKKENFSGKPRFLIIRKIIIFINNLFYIPNSNPGAPFSQTRLRVVYSQ
ncbi:MAG: sulfotransferase [Candidatus Moranbacteria bacterium]|nr:sulfotransferase [Candidatus Moranbacteria bacterium]